MCGIGLDNGFASYEEVANAKLQQEKKDTISNEQWKSLNQMYSKDEIKAMYQELGITSGKQIPVDYYNKKVDEYSKNLDGQPKEFY